MPGAAATTRDYGARGPQRDDSRIARESSPRPGPGFAAAMLPAWPRAGAPPLLWDIASGDGVLWKSEVPGLGNSSPIVSGGRVIVTTAVSPPASPKASAPAPPAPAPRSTRRSSTAGSSSPSTRAPASKLWETEVGRGVPASRRHMKATQANSTPATDGRRIVVVFPTAGLAVLDLDGRLLWKRDLGPLRVGAFNDPTLEWGFASSPLLYGDRVILQVDIHEGAYLAAWDLETGKELWRTARDGRGAVVGDAGVVAHARRRRDGGQRFEHPRLLGAPTAASCGASAPPRSRWSRRRSSTAASSTCRRAIRR